MSPDLRNLSGVQQRPPGSVEFIKIILFWLLLRQVQNLGFELEILHVQHYFYLTLNEQTCIAPPSAPVCPDMSIRPRPGYLTSWPLSNSPFKSDLCLFPRLLVFLSHRQINELVINPESFFLFLRVTIFWPREKKRNWFHSWPMRRAETCFWKRENKNVSRQRKTWIHDFRLLNIPRIQTRTVNRYYRTGLIASLTNRDPRTVPGFNG